MRSVGKFMFAGASLLALSVPAYAEEQPAPAAPAAADDATAAADDASDKDIVVIGTLIRGTQAVGSQTLSVDAATIAQQGAGTTNQLLGALPQLVGTFNGRFEVDPRGFSTGTNSVNKPNLRSLPAAGSGAVTLVTVDGMRITPVGINDAATDVDIIPASVLAGIDAVTDGGSSLYGADAVGGVLNFRTRRKFDGIKLDFNYSMGTTIKSFTDWDGTIMAGKSWSSGNAYISATRYERAQVINADVPWSSGLVYNAAGVGSFASTECISPVGSRINYYSTNGTGGYTSNPLAPGAGRVPVGTACDQVSSESYTPKTNRTNIFGSVTQDFSDTISFRATGYYAKRDMFFAHYPVGASTADAPAPTNPTPPATIVTVLGGTGFSFGANAAYVNRPSSVGFETWGVTPELTVKVGQNWQVRAAVHYGKSNNASRFPTRDGTLVTQYLNSGALNPLNVAAASAQVITDITNFETANDTKETALVARAIADGTLFTLPAGDVKLAIGVEYQYNKAQVRSALGKVDSIDSVAFIGKSNNAKSVFAELQIPVFEFLDLAASGRYDDYNSFGSTFNPNLGATLKPTDWLKIFGHWNTSFNAPTAIDSIGLGSGRLACGVYKVNGTPGTSERPNDPLSRDTSKQGTCALILTGGRPGGLKPQTADSWAVGFEAKPLHGLNVGAEFYSINFKNVIGAINPANTSTYTTNPDSYIYNILQPAYTALLAQLGNGTSISGQQPNASNIALVVDSRISNLNAARVQGLDLHLNYDFKTGFGRFSFGANGNVPTRALVSNNGAVTNERGHLNPKYTVSTFLTFESGGWTIKPTVNIRGPFRNATVDYLGKDVFTDPFVLTNLFVSYKIQNENPVIHGLQLRLNVDNVFNKEPTRIKLANTNFPSYTNWTLGRVFKFGITKEF